MKTLLALLVGLVGVLSPAQAQHQGRERNPGNNGQHFPRGGQQHGGGQNQQGGGQRRDFPRQDRGNQNRGGDQRRERERTWTPPQNNQGGSQERRDRSRDNDRRDNDRRIIVPNKPVTKPNPDQWRRDERREDTIRRGTIIRRPDTINPGQGDRRQDGQERRRDDHQGRLRGRLGGPQQTPTRREPLLRQDPARGRRFGGVLKPSLRDRSDLEPMYRNHQHWPDYRQAPKGYTRWDRAPRRSDWNLTIGAAWIGGSVALHHRNETTYGGYWWHEEHGTRYAHHCDAWGRHWYGWYVGSNYYWTRWHGGYWWWYDPIRYRWVYWHERRWWYQDPVNITVVYVYDDDEDRYYRYDDRQDRVVLTPETPAAGTTAPATDAQSFYSTDGSRLVQVVGPEKHGYLHDTAENPSFEPVYLGKGVSEVRFKYVDGGDGDVEVDQVLVLKADGTFDVFDGDGYAKGEPEKAETPALDSLNQWEKDPHE